MKLIYWAIFSLVAVLGLPVMAQTNETTDVAAYLQKGFGLNYKPVDDGMKCRQNVSTPFEKVEGDNAAFRLTCLTWKEASMPINFGWMPRKFSTFEFHKVYAKLIAQNANQTIVLTRDVLKCDTSRRNDGSGETATCTFTLGEEKKVINFFVAYQSLDVNNHFFVLVSDGFKGKPTEIKAIALEYSSRITKPGISASAQLPTTQ